MSDIFPSTVWSQIRVGDDADRRRTAFSELVLRYGDPIRVWIRAAFRVQEDDASDLTQDFLSWVLESEFLTKADPSLGRFRAFLKTALRRYVIDDRRRQRAAKRGGGAHAVELADEVAPGESPEERLDLAWRASLVQRALAQVEEAMRADGRERAFALFRDYYVEPEEGVDYATLAAKHGISEVDVSNALARTKKRYRAELKAQVVESVQTAEDLEVELRWLFGKDGA